MIGCDEEPAEISQASGISEAARLDRAYRVEAPRLLRFFRRRLQTADTAFDLLQEAFARLLGSSSGRALDNPGPYLQRIARNMMIDRARSMEGKLALRHQPFDEELMAPVVPNQEEKIDADDLLRIYHQALANLPARTRETFLLHRVDEMTYAEIADHFGVSVGTVEYHIGRALAHFDRAVEAAR